MGAAGALWLLWGQLALPHGCLCQPWVPCLQVVPPRCACLSPPPLVRTAVGGSRAFRVVWDDLGCLL